MAATPILNEIANRKNAEVFHAKSWGLDWGDDLISELKSVALESNLSRSRLCLHPAPEDPHQEMLIVMTKQAIERPQKRTIGFDTKIVIEGEAILKYFSNEGRLTREVKLGKNNSTYIHTCIDEFHNLEIKSEWFIFLEILEGPFTKETTLYANFSSSEI